MRSFQHGWEGMRNGNGMNGIKLCFSMKEERKEGRKEGRVWQGFHRIRKQFRLYQSPKKRFLFFSFFFFFFNLPRNLDDARILKMYGDIKISWINRFLSRPIDVIERRNSIVAKGHNSLSVIATIRLLGGWEILRQRIIFIESIKPM